jgi:predicted nucleic-acid-binding Zn-ribbon protein
MLNVRAEEESMKSTGRCPKCSCGEIIQRARVLDRSHSITLDLQVAVDADPDALIFKGRQKFVVQAWMCKSCGYVELYRKQQALSPNKPLRGIGAFAPHGEP